MLRWEEECDEFDDEVVAGSTAAVDRVDAVAPHGAGGLWRRLQRDGEVTVNELVLSVNIALGTASVNQCLASDS